MNKIYVSRIHFPITALGPGKRVGLWFQGCSIRCPGCISADTWNEDRGQILIEDLCNRIRFLSKNAEGLTVSGGEPFEQSEALSIVLNTWRSVSSTSILVFTGYEFINVKPWLDKNPGLVDALITGPYKSNFSQTLALRGSDNQELHILSGAGEEFLAYERTRTSSDLHLDVMFDDSGDAWLAGIPARGDFTRLRHALKVEGIDAKISNKVERQTQ